MLAVCVADHKVCATRALDTRQHRVVVENLVREVFLTDHVAQSCLHGPDQIAFYLEFKLSVMAPQLAHGSFEQRGRGLRVVVHPGSCSAPPAIGPTAGYSRWLFPVYTGKARFGPLASAMFRCMSM